MFNLDHSLRNTMRELDAVRREIERGFENFGPKLPGWPFSRAAFLPGRGVRAYPLTNVAEDKDNVYVEALAPGVKPETFEVSVVGDQLTIAGVKNALPDNVKPEAFHRTERASGKFIRTIALPAEVDPDKVSASYKDGLLLVTLPKAEIAKPKQIAVKIG